MTPGPVKPQRGDRATFKDRVDDFVSWVIDAVPQFAALATNVYNNAIDAYGNAVAAANSATASGAQANIAVTKATAAAASADAAAASAGSAAISAAAAAGTQVITSSPSNLTIGAGDKVFAVAAGKQFAINAPIIAVDADNPARYMAGTVKAYAGVALTIAVTDVGGAGNGANWNISIAGVRGLKGDPGIASAAVKRIARTANTQLVFSDQQAVVEVTSGTFTQTFDSAVNLGNGWFVWYRNGGNGDVTLDPAGAETIDGLSSFVVYPGELRLIQCDGAALNSYVVNPFFKEFLSSGTFIKPPGYRAFSGFAWGAGGGREAGSLAHNSVGARCGGGGVRIPLSFKASALPAAVSVLIGAGGPPGVVGGSTVFHTATAYGGGGANSGAPGGGGGALSAGGAGTVGAPAQFTDGTAFVDNSIGGGFPAGVSVRGAGKSVDGGAGGGDSGSGYNIGGFSVNGGAGGSTSTGIGDNPAGGTSTNGGQGGRGGFAVMQIQGTPTPNLTAGVTVNLAAAGALAGDLGIIVTYTSHSTDATPATPAGWTFAGSYSGGVGTFGANSGVRRVTVFTRVMAGSDAAVSVTGTGFSESVVASYLVKAANGSTPTVSVVGGADNTAGTSYSVATGAIDVAVDDLLLAATCINGYSGSPSGVPTFSLAGATFAEVLPNGYYNYNTGNGMQMTNWAARVSAGAGNAALTFSLTYTSTTGNTPAGATALLRIRGAAYAMDGQQPGGGCGGFGKKGGDGALQIWGIV
jgi:hypothetical protein